MTKRIFRSILAVSLAVLLASSLLIVGVLHGYFQDSVLADLTIRTAYIAHGIENEGIVYLEEDLPGGCRITLVDTDGTVLYDNREDPAQMENHADREEIHEAAMLGQGRAVRVHQRDAAAAGKILVQIVDSLVFNAMGDVRSANRQIRQDAVLKIPVKHAHNQQ